MKIKIPKLRNLMVSILMSKYYSLSEAEKIADVFMYAELTGKNTQGVLKLMGSDPAQNVKPEYKPKVNRKTKLSALVDGGKSAGPLGAQIAVDTLINIASGSGFGIVGLNNTFSSIGALSYYAKKLAEKDLIGIVAASSPRAIIYPGTKVTPSEIS